MKLLNWTVLSLVLCCVAVVSDLSAADKKGKDEIKEVEVRELTNQAFMAGFRQFTEAKGMKVRQFGKGPVRLFTAGKSNIDDKKGAELIKTGEQALMGLEAWTGKQKMFTPRTKSEADAYCIVVLESDGAFDQLLAYMRERGTAKTPDGHQDLAKAYKTMHGPRSFFTTAKKFEAISKNWMANEISTMALSTYFHERRTSVPIWLSIGVTSEMERILCERVLIYKVSYEKNDNVTKGNNSQGNWARDFNNLLKKGPKSELVTAHQAMTFDLVGMSYNQYIQLWSVGSFIRAATAKGSKKKNKFAKIIKRMANGEVDINVVVDVFGSKSDKNLTGAWHAWARTQK